MRLHTRTGLLGVGLLLALGLTVEYATTHLPTAYSTASNWSPFMNSRVLEFALGEKGDTIIQRASSSIQRSGVSSALFYTARNMQYRLKHPKHGLTFPLASTVLFYDDASDTYGVDEVNMRLDLPKRPILKKISDAELEIYDRHLYELVMALQASIQAVGWKRFIMLSDPRLTGRTTYHFKEGHLNQPSVASLKLVSPFLADPDYRLSWEDWKGGLKEQVQQSVNFSALAKRTQSRFQNIIINGRLTEPSRSACTRFSLPKAYPMTSSSVAETAAIHNPPFIA